MGNRTDVKQAYSFLSQYYDKESSLHFYGFSRGAYTARILAGMIYTVGIYDLKHLSEEQREKIIDKLYDAYKGGNIFLNEEKSFKAIRNDSRDVINEWSDGKIFLISDNVKIKVMGLWDTVEALGVTQTIESIKDTFGIEDPQKIENPNKRYFDQICNIENTFHAIALDDNRANVFTPIILTGHEVIRRCEDNLSMKDRIANQIIHVDEVWFSGAHADVGGGYKLVSEKGKITEDNSLSGVSLNWMLSKIKTVDTKLFPVNFNVYENILGFIHDAESYPLVNNALYKNGTRANIIKKYLDVSNYNTMKIHTSVVDRLNKKIDNNNYNSKWYLSNSKCINKENKDLYTTTTKCVKVNNDQSLK
jgi:T6SS, Phospholipase effector Tle1-like, catalytic domain